jgi:dTDP-D-glucose 4,6-dehydratase
MDVDVVLGILIAVCVLTIAFQYEHIQTLNADLKTYYAEITQLENDAQEQKNRFNIAQNAAFEQVKNIQKQTDTVMKTKVSPNCDKSIEWLKNQAKEIHP